MRITLRLQQILEEQHALRHGSINELAEGAKIPRQQIAAMLKNQVKYVSLEALGRICDYLARTYQIDRTQLPGLLFALEPSEFLGMLGWHKFIEICFGVRHDKNGHELISASDSYLQGKLLGELFGVGRDRHRRDVDDDDHEHEAEQQQPTGDESSRDKEGGNDWPVPSKQHFLRQKHVPAFDRSIDTAAAHRVAGDVYGAFHREGGERTLICLGSIKSNVLIELLMANAFGAVPFEAEDDVATPDQRRCPVYFRLRPNDPRPVSCYAGMRPAKSVHDSQPGIYFEKDDRTWGCCPCTETEDAALVLYVYHRGSGVLEVVMGGFSGRATRTMADQLSMFADQLWPPGYDHNNLAIGAFVVRFAAKKSRRTGSGSKSADDSANGHDRPELNFKEVIPISGDVIGRRVEPQKSHRDARA